MLIIEAENTGTTAVTQFSANLFFPDMNDYAINNLHYPYLVVDENNKPFPFSVIKVAIQPSEKFYMLVMDYSDNLDMRQGMNVILRYEGLPEMKRNDGIIMSMGSSFAGCLNNWNKDLAKRIQATSPEVREALFKEYKGKYFSKVNVLKAETAGAIKSPTPVTSQNITTQNTVTKSPAVRETEALIASGKVNEKNDQGETVLMRAAMHGNLDVVNTLIKGGALVNLQSKNGTTALMLVVDDWGNYKVVGENKFGVFKALLAAGADVNLKNGNNQTALEMASQKHNAEYAKLLLAAGADIKGEIGSNALVEFMKDIDIVKTLLAGEVDINMVCHRGTHNGFRNKTPLMIASEKKYTTVVELLLAHGADVNMENDRGETALMCAVNAFDLKIVKILLAAGADIYVKNHDGKTARDMAQANYSHDIVALLDAMPVKSQTSVQNANVKQPNISKQDTEALFKASKRNDVQQIKTLIASGANVNVTDENTKRTPLMEAIAGENIEIIKLLVEAGAAVNTQDKFGRSPLMIATIRENLDVLRILLAAKADLKLQDNDGLDALQIAAQCGNDTILRGFIVSGADVKATDKQGMTALMWAVKNGENADAVKVLLEAGSDVHHKSKNGKTVLSMALDGEKTNAHIVKLLLEAQADPNETDGRGVTFLMKMAEREKLEIVKLLLAAHADVNAKTDGGKTALMFCMDNGRGDYEAIIRLLLVAKANVHYKDDSGKTARDYARRESIQKLLDAAASGAEIQYIGNAVTTPLMIAARNGNSGEVRRLLAGHVNINAQNENGETALMIAAGPVMNNVTIVRSLLNAGANKWLKNNKGETARDIAIRGGGLNNPVVRAIDGR